MNSDTDDIHLIGGIKEDSAGSTNGMGKTSTVMRMEISAEKAG